MTIAEAMALALEHHQANRLQAAEQVYRQILAVEPSNVDALQMLALVAAQVGQHATAIQFIERAIQFRSDDPRLYNNLGEAYRAMHQFQAAMNAYRRALDLAPNLPEIHFNLGNVHLDQRQFTEAVAWYQNAVQLRPAYAAAWCNLGNAHQQLGQLEEAAASLGQASQIEPYVAEHHHNRGLVLSQLGQFREAIACFQRALQCRPTYVEPRRHLGTLLRNLGQLENALLCFQQALHLDPGDADAHHNLGLTLFEMQRLPDAIACYQRALQLRPDDVPTLNNLGVALREQGQLDQALVCLKQALGLGSAYAETHNNVGICLKDQGQVPEAMASFRQALAINPRLAEVHSNLLYAMHFCPDLDAAAIYEEHRRWNQQHAEPLAKFMQPLAKSSSPNRRLRIGYVSPDFRVHPVGRFMAPLLQAHDRAQFEIFCYASQSVNDSVTQRCREHTDVWRSIGNLSDESVAQTVREDHIDILVDLSMHSANNRLLVFARKPAPVQVTYLAYAGTTGLSTMAFRLTDPYLDPPGRQQGHYSEESIWLPETYWCYATPTEAPDVNTLPASHAGHVTFGCLNKFGKLSAPALKTWCRILQMVPGSRLLLHASPGSQRERCKAELAAHQIAPDRLEFVGFMPLADYFRTYCRLDVALDPFPFGGGTTTCDALWMGVPVVSLAGNTAVGRGGLSILSNLGLPELVAHSADQVISIAAELANDLQRLRQLRASLRERMRQSPLMDARRFARNVEAAYHDIWQH